ncbi:MAG: cell division protein SepF [Candidatus Gastranaerophilales bacterium]|nr:cell division protein SepF [Candidatus Gastranaerophilales bacterium]
MAVSDKIKSIVGFLTSGFENRDDIFEDMEGEVADYPIQDNLAMEPMYSSSSSRNQDLKVVNHPNFRGYEVMVCEPRSYDESVGIVKHLKDKKTIILNLHLLDKDQAMRIVDFLCGATHALSGNQQKIGDTVFIFTPQNVALSAESQKSKFIRDALWNQPQ